MGKIYFRDVSRRLLLFALLLLGVVTQAMAVDRYVIVFKDLPHGTTEIPYGTSADVIKSDFFTVYESNATEVTKFASLASVGPDGGSTINGWSTLTVTIAQTGNYTFYFGVVNGFDSISPSELWLDGAYAGDAPPEIESRVPRGP